MQYFYIVVYTIVGDDLTMCKVGLNPRQLTKWGRREATKNQDRTYGLYRQPITSTGKISFVKYLTPFVDKKLEAAIKAAEHSLKVVKSGGFDWDAFEANRSSRGADMDIDIIR